MWFFYQLAIASLLLLGGPVLLARRGRHYLATLRGRLGGGTEPGAHPIDEWIHAVSVGEVAVAATLIADLPAERSVLVTTITPTGQARARQLLGERARIAYLPFDLDPCLHRFWRRHQPKRLILIEGEAWPLMLHRARRKGLRVALVNGRLSDRSYPRLSRFPAVARRLYRDLEAFGVQTEGDARRWRALGIADERIVVTGNLKYDSPEPARSPVLETQLTELAAGRPILIAGSTMEGEDALVGDAFCRAGGGESALLLLAPRHPERFGSAQKCLEDAGLVVRRRSNLDRHLDASDASVGLLPNGRNRVRTDVLLLDTVGELAALYRLALGAFVGGTLVPSGGHNPLEPARFGVAVVVGPSMQNFREIADHFDRASAWQRVDNATDLAAIWLSWITEPERARDLGALGQALVSQHRGATQRTRELLARLEPSTSLPEHG
jgi:3-deoxy-D-manno-octulosonic-acid transferase